MHELEEELNLIEDRLIELKSELAFTRDLLETALDVAETNAVRPKSEWCKTSHAWIEAAKKLLEEGEYECI